MLEDSAFHNASDVTIHKAKVCDIPCYDKYGLLYVYELSHLFCSSPKLHYMFFPKNTGSPNIFTFLIFHWKCDLLINKAI